MTQETTVFSGAVEPKLHIFCSPKLKSIVNKAIKFLEKTPVHQLPPKGAFRGVGVYVLYYVGNSEYYRSIARANKVKCRKAIYVGKAVPEGWRSGRTSQSDNNRGLQNRLREHKRSIGQSQNLIPKDFRCRFMILQGIEADLISAIEAQLIRNYSPVWNTLVDGFGNHDPGSGRYNQSKSEWDTLHPGRPWAEKLTGVPPKIETIKRKLKKKR